MSIAEYDVIVIGSGMAGLTAGIQLLRSGLHVAMVTSGEPTVCLSTGCIDFCAGESPIQAISALPANHPFCLVPSAQLLRVQNDFLDIMAQKDLPYTGSLEENRRILTSLGTSKTTCLVPVTMQAAPQDPDEAVHVVTFQGLKDFYPGYIMEKRAASFSVFDAGVDTTMGIAAQFEQEDFRETFLSWLTKQNIREGKIAFPAVLGMESAFSILKQIEEVMARPVFEIPTLPPSMPGRRLFNAMKDYFRSIGGEIYWNWEVAGVEKSSTMVEGVYTITHGRPNSLHAKAFILATGSFVGGGLWAHRNAVEEKVFDLPVYTPETREEWFAGDYFSPHHGISEAGVVVQADFRPGDCSLQNLYVCGGILAHARILHQGCGNGLALATGYATALSCEDYLK
jgi:glycerol-3-phosphate dehydrogenase subunit B